MLLDERSAWGNPFEHRELMRSVVGWSDKTPDEVLAEQKQRAKNSEPKTKRSKAAPSGPPELGPPPTSSQRDALMAMLNRPPATE